MGYHVEFVEPVARILARVEGLSDADRAAVIDGVIEELSRDADRFYALRPLAHESHCFRYDYAHITAQTLYTFDFVVDASHLEMSVVRAAYVECTSEPVG